MNLREGKIKLIYLLVLVIILVAGITFLVTTLLEKNQEKTDVSNTKSPEAKNETIRPDEGKNYHIETYKNKDYYIIDDDYQEEYDIQKLDLLTFLDEDSSWNDGSLDDFEVCEVMNYDKYKEYCDKWDIKKTYSDDDLSYIVLSYMSKGSVRVDVRLAEVEHTKKTAKLYIWDDFNGVTADIAAYVIVIPTEEKVDKVETQALLTQKEYHNLIGKSPSEGADYDLEDNKILAQNAYIKTNNDKVNEVFNKMLDAIVNNHTIEIKRNNKTLSIMDLNSSNFKRIDEDGDIEYIAYGEEYSKVYSPFGDGGYEYTEGVSRDYLIYDVALYYVWGMVLGLTDENKNPYYYKDFPLLDTAGYTCKIQEKGKQYIITCEFPEEDASEEYYINKETYLLEKTIIDFPNEDNGEFTYKYTDEEVTIPNKVLKNAEPEITIDKPVIYLYPQKETEVDVKLKYKEKITVSYPKYTNGWKVLAKVGGDLVDLKTNRHLYSLYYESKSIIDFKVEDEGFIVKGKDSIKFLEEKLALLGLSEREAEEFIIYWLPKLESNKYNYIRFATAEEINKNMPLEINPTPDNVIRVLMTFKGIDKPIEVKEQKLVTPERTGFTVVEWGGTEIK